MPFPGQNLNLNLLSTLPRGQWVDHGVDGRIVVPAVPNHHILMIGTGRLKSLPSANWGGLSPAPVFYVLCTVFFLLYLCTTSF